MHDLERFHKYVRTESRTAVFAWPGETPKVPIMESREDVRSKEILTDGTDCREAALAKPRTIPNEV